MPEYLGRLQSDNYTLHDHIEVPNLHPKRRNKCNYAINYVLVEA